jgi:uncharacterized membrane protein YedE/YeeE
MKYGFVFFGAVFGFLLSRAGATTFDFYARLFLFSDPQLLWVIVVAGAVGASGIMLLKRFRAHALVDGRPLSYSGKPMRKELVVGASLFGVGWGLSAACPGTAPAMLGEGKLLAGFVILGIVIGTYLFGRLHRREKGGD